jgi:nitrogen-specific signal transduction histidine kinase
MRDKSCYIKIVKVSIKEVDRVRKKVIKMSLTKSVTKKEWVEIVEILEWVDRLVKCNKSYKSKWVSNEESEYKQSR